MRFERLKILIGEENLKKLSQKHVAVFGVGGVGGYALEALARSAIGEFTIVDYDTVDVTNINRQIIATESTIGQYKTDLFEKRIKDINPEIILHKITEKYTSLEREKFFSDYDYVVDAIDMVGSKVDLIVSCFEKNIPIISSMGMGNRLDPSKIRITTIDRTYNCKLAKVMRRELKKHGIDNLTCVFSDEITEKSEKMLNGKKETVGSSAFVPSVAGLSIASYIVRDFIGDTESV